MGYPSYPQAHIGWHRARQGDGQCRSLAVVVEPTLRVKEVDISGGRSRDVEYDLVCGVLVPARSCVREWAWVCGLTRWPSSCTSQQLVLVRAITSRIYALVRAGCTVMTRKSEPPHLGSMWCGTRACRSAGPSFTLNGALHLVRTHHHSDRFGPVRTAPALWRRVSPHLQEIDIN